MSDTWRDRVGGAKADHYLDLEIWRDGSSGPEWRAVVKWDGCVHLHQYFNGVNPDEDKDAQENTEYLHICDIDDMIEKLQALKAKALEHFGKDWPR